MTIKNGLELLKGHMGVLLRTLDDTIEKDHYLFDKDKDYSISILIPVIHKKKAGRFLNFIASFMNKKLVFEIFVTDTPEFDLENKEIRSEILFVLRSIVSIMGVLVTLTDESLYVGVHSNAAEKGFWLLDNSPETFDIH